jgi:hypothetical protein
MATSKRYAGLRTALVTAIVCLVCTIARYEAYRLLPRSGTGVGSTSPYYWTLANVFRSVSTGASEFVSGFRQLIEHPLYSASQFGSNTKIMVANLPGVVENIRSTWRRDPVAFSVVGLLNGTTIIVCGLIARLCPAGPRPLHDTEG